jgi:hypothetical protein
MSDVIPNRVKDSVRNPLFADAGRKQLPHRHSALSGMTGVEVATGSEFEGYSIFTTVS